MDYHVVLGCFSAKVGNYALGMGKYSKKQSDCLKRAAALYNYELCEK
ncbi:MAG: hypothetical protein R2798_14905 [Chitinophagales bacterium]|nr:hypothetical protein [Bacteroidota bacterium]